MNEKDRFALVPKPSSALEKAEAGAKRVLSGMVADTLALVKKEPSDPSKPRRMETPREHEARMKRLGQEAEVARMEGRLRPLDSLPKTVFVPYVSPLNRSLCIVVVDDEDWFMEFLELAILAKFKNVTLQTFQDSNKAWLELSRTNPDLLIVGGVMPELDGEEIVRRLVGRKVPYPIIVVSGWPLTERWVREYTVKNPNITFLAKPFTAEQLQEKLSQYLSGDDNP